MKVISLLAGAAAALAFTVPAIVADDAAATKAMKDSGCTKCHAVDKAKKGPAYQKIAANS